MGKITILEENPIDYNSKRSKTGVRIVHNKLLGGWFVVRGPHQTPISGRFDTKAEAEASLVKAKKNPSKRTRRSSSVRYIVADHQDGRVFYFTGDGFSDNKKKRAPYPTEKAAESDAREIINRVPRGIVTIRVVKD